MALIQYALWSETPKDQQELDRYGLAINPLQFQIVPQAVAEADIEHGCWAVFTNHGTKAGDWFFLSYDNNDLGKELSKLKPFPPLEDMFGVQLNVGDYAISAFNTRGSNLSVCKVVGYTEDKVKVIHHGRVVGRNPSLLVRVHESVITPDVP